MGRDFENFLVNVKKLLGLKASSPDTIQPFSMHVPGSFVSMQGTSKLNRDQVVAALELLSEFVNHTGHNPGDVVVICPYKANVEFGNRIVSRYEALAGLPKFQTADSFQGQEGKMHILIFISCQRSNSNLKPFFLSLQEFVESLGLSGGKALSNVLLFRSYSLHCAKYAKKVTNGGSDWANEINS
ncbi:hypothetical protein V8F20_004640 [Naviculisporaceae sp. PSN 640]